MVANALSFVVGDYVVYPKHGVGRVVAQIEHRIGHRLADQRQGGEVQYPGEAVRPEQRRHGFRVQHYRLELFGSCPSCANGRPAARTR